LSNWLLYASAVLIWGSTWFAINFQLGVVSVEVSLAYRFLIASAILFGWCAVKRLPLRFDVRSHAHFAGMGVFLFGLNYLCAYSAQLYITSALNAIAFTAILWFNIANARIFLGTRIGRRTWLGALAGMIGTAVIFWPEVRELSLSDRMLVGAGFSLVGALFASFGNLASALSQRRGLAVVQSNAWGMLYGGLLTAAIAIGRGEAFTFEPTPAYLVSLVYLSVFGSVLAFGAYLTLLGRIGAERAGYTVVMIPVVALLVSALFENLRLTPAMGAGVALALAGNLLILGRFGRA
jgi:drug/metabolite transporter (DMT)-like permease